MLAHILLSRWLFRFALLRMKVRRKNDSNLFRMKPHKEQL
jgi:hypothetical protein